MRKLFFATSLIASTTLLFGCQQIIQKLKGGADAGADAESALVDAEAPAEVTPTVDAAPEAPAPPPVTAKNVADVARFPGESAVVDDGEKVAAVSEARTAPKSGSIVARLQPGTEVTKIAEYQSSVLVSFADPKDASSTLLGWVAESSFSAPIVKRVATDAGAPNTSVPDAGKPADAGAVLHLDAGLLSLVDAGAILRRLTCPIGMATVTLGKEPVCRKRCTKDTDCGQGKAGSCAPATTTSGSVAKVCVDVP